SSLRHRSLHSFPTRRSSDLWRAFNDGLAIDVGASALAIDPGNPAIVYASVYDSTGGKGIFKSTNGGVSWSATNSGIINLHVGELDRKSTRLNSSHVAISYAV